MVHCPTEDLLQRLLVDDLPPVERSPLEAHIEECTACQHQLERLTTSSQLRRYSSETPTVQPALRGEHGADVQTKGTPASASECDRPETDQAAELLRMMSPSPEPGSLGRVGSYDLLELIGVGGAGAVFRALDQRLQRVVALKLLLPHLAVSGDARRRFEREARSAAAVAHENVIAVYDVGQTNGLLFLVMEYVAGVSLAQRLRSGPPFSVEEIVRIGREIVNGLAAAHAQGLVHRDIKPSNILLEAATGRAKLSDFGLARAVDDVSLTRTGVVAGTPLYMSPEQTQADKLDQRSDLFSLGSVLYTLATGQPPFRADTTLALLRQVAEDTPRPISELNPATPVWLCRIIAHLMAKDPGQRFQTAEEASQGLEAGLMAPAPEPTLRQDPRRPLRRLLLPVGLLAMAGTLATIATWLTSDASGPRLSVPEEHAVRPDVLAASPRSDTRPASLPGGVVAIPGDRVRFVYPRLSKHRNQAKISKDGRLLAAPSGLDANVELFDAATGAHLHTLSGPNDDQIRELAFSEDGTLLAAIAYYPNKKPALRVWDLTVRKELFTYRGEMHDNLSHPKISPNGKLVVAFQTSPEALLYVWNARTGQEISTLPGRTGNGEFSPDGKLLAGLTGKKNAVIVYNTDNWEVLRTLPCERVDFSDMHFSPDGGLLALGGNNRLVVWRTDTFDKMRDYEVPFCHDWFDFLADGKTLLAKSTNGSLPAHTYTRWDVDTGTKKGEFPVVNPTPDFQYCSLSPDRKNLIVVNYEHLPYLRLYDPASGKER
jgi:serine/threonine protein kinase